MTSLTQPVTAIKWMKPPISLTKDGKKILLRLRVMSFAKEIIDLPADMLEIHGLLVQKRANQNENTYMMVAAWNKLRVYEKYWTSFDFTSEGEYLAYYDLPDGTTLAGRTVMVNLFDRETFILLGDEVLSFMLRSVGQYQPDTDERKKDYQSIFDSYCAARDSFDKTDFYITVRNYVKRKYELPMAKNMGMTHEEWTKQGVTKQNGTTKRRKVVKTEAKQNFGPVLTHDFAWDEKTCSSCSEKSQIISVMSAHLEKLEAIITDNLGDNKLPERPKEIKDL